MLKSASAEPRITAARAYPSLISAVVYRVLVGLTGPLCWQLIQFVGLSGFHLSWTICPQRRACDAQVLSVRA